MPRRTAERAFCRLSSGTLADGRFRAYVAQALGGRYQDLFQRSALNVHLQAPTHEASVRWRIEQGRSELAARGLDPAALDPERIRRFLDLFQRVGTWPRAPCSELRVVLDEDHLPARIVASRDVVEDWTRACGPDFLLRRRATRG